MYVCHCHGITDKAIRQAVADGASTMADIKRDTLASTQCGSCAMQVAAIVREELVKTDTPFYNAA
ncbi:(2Fe-2S)-binding protein [Echinimonas agarilytica]|uniref:Bacterioferritin-associated ferredoxin n=1 Tax=Echinimonas agarilytica TaxID=1215918 RepID=A0AA41W9A0_9GAMM|nr:(2Fe-2S)-binding protein [Echinimonas agarilytica]MCM2681106.1 (2Fe-2S)-binding protein [Echinimonas agarilytica]